MRLIIITTILIFSLVLIFPAVLVFGLKDIPSNVQPSFSRAVKIFAQQSVVQSFKFEGNSLSGIGVSIKNPNLVNKKDIVLSLYDDSGYLLRSATVNGAHIPDGKFVKFLFPSIENPARSLTFTITSPDSSWNEALEVFLTKDSPFWSQQFMLVPLKPLSDKEEQMSEGLAFVNFYRVSSYLSLITDIYSVWISRLVADLPFFSFYVTILLLGVGFLLKEKISTKFRVGK